MTFPASTKNSWLNGQAVDTVSLHSGFPGTTGANEVTGGTPAYARKAITLNAASAGQRILAAGVTFDVPATTVRWIGFWSGSTFVGCAANGGATPKNFVVSGSLVYCPGHSWSDTQKIAFFGVPPTGVVEGTVYFIRDSTTDSFHVTATSGGSAITLSGASSFGCVVVAVVEDTYSTQGTHGLTAATIAIPD